MLWPCEPPRMSEMGSHVRFLTRVRVVQAPDRACTCVRSGAQCFSGLEVPRDHALDDMPLPMVSETRFTSQIPGSPAAHVPCRCSRSCAWDGIVMLRGRYLDTLAERQCIRYTNLDLWISGCLMVCQALQIMIRIMRYGLINLIFKGCAIRKARACARKRKIGRTYTSPISGHVTQHLSAIFVYCMWLLRPEIWRKAHTLVCRTHKLHAGIFRKHMPHDAEPDMKSLIHHHAAFDS